MELRETVKSRNIVKLLFDIKNMAQVQNLLYLSKVEVKFVLGFVQNQTEPILHLAKYSKCFI
jgi:hypothetical protein